MQTLRLFISSPGDVRDERQVVGRVIERLQGKYWSFVRLDDVFWEDRAVRATAHYQDELINPGECDLVVGVLWSKLGSPLPAKFAALSGASRTGTEWELEEAFSAYENHVGTLINNGSKAEEAAKLASPDILVYRRKPAPIRENLDPADVAQLDQLETYLRENYQFPDGTIKRPVLSYRSLEEFEEKLTNHLTDLILKRLPGLKRSFEPPPISGCPFKGLSVFRYEDSDRFFGRNRQIREVQDLLRQRAEAGKAFVLIYGASGYGKSSLMQAGLAPVLTRPGGARPGMDRWRRVLIQPATGTGSLCERLARAILSPSTDSEKEQANVHEHYTQSGFPELSGCTISDPEAKGSSWDVASLARYLSDPENRVFAIADLIAALAAKNQHLLLQVDQLEEIFAENVGTEERAAFIGAIDALGCSGRVWCLATMRSEYFPKVAEEPELRSLLGRDGGYILPPPDWQSWSEIIRFPALAARLDWERTIEPRQIGEELSTEEWLNEQILEDVKDNPDALPLLEFCLERLYHDTIDPEDPEGLRRERDLLTWDSYAAMDGLRGAIATEANQAYEKLPPSAQGARDYLFGNLVRVDGTVTRRRADLTELEKKPGAATFLQAFLNAKLLVTDEEDGRAVISLAHESLLSHWPVLSEWIEKHRSDLAAHQRLIKQAQLWEEHGKSRKYLLAEGHLAEAERVAVSSYFLLSVEQSEFLRESQNASRKKLRLFQGATLVFALLAIGAGVLGWLAEKRKVEAQTNAKLAEEQRVEAVRQAEVATATKNFVTNMFATADPNNARGSETTVRQILQRASMIGGIFQDNPAVEWDIRYVLETIARVTGEHDLALAHSEALLELSRTVHGESDKVEVASTHNSRGGILKVLGRYEEALPHFKLALEMRQRLFKSDDSTVAVSLYELGMCLADLGRYDEGLSYCQDSLEMYQRLFPGDHLQTSISFRGVAGCLVRLDRMEEALDHYQAGLAMAQRMFSDEDHPEVAGGLIEMASCLSNLDRNEEALKHFQRGLEIIQKVYPGDHPQVAAAFHNLASCLKNLGRFEEALLQFQSSLNMYQRMFPGDHPDVVTSRSGVAKCLFALDRKEEALSQFKAALEILERISPGDRSDKHGLLANVANCLKELGRNEEALAQFNAAFEMAQRLSPEGNPKIATILDNVGSCLLAIDKPDEALVKFQKALEMRQKIFTGDHPDVLRSINNLAICQTNMTRLDDALPQFEASLDMTKRIFPGENENVVSAYYRLADCLNGLDRGEEALPYFVSALEMRQRMHNSDHPDVAHSFNLLASCLNNLDRNEEALPNFRMALEMGQRLATGDNENVAIGLTNVAACLQALNRPEEALPQFFEALEMTKRLSPGDHADIANVLDNLASCLNDLGRRDEALLKYQAALEMRQRIFPEDHSDVIDNHQRIAEFYDALGQLDSSQNHFLIAQNLRRRKGFETYVTVTDVLAGSQAERLGIRAGDLIIKHADVTIFSGFQFIRLRRESTGSQVELTLLRKNKPIEMQTEGGILGAKISLESIPYSPDSKKE